VKDEMTNQTWVPRIVDPNRPSIARIYDYYLGGRHNVEADRQAGAEVVAILPEFPATLRVTRYALRRTVRYLADVGIRAFLDLGSGIPTVDNVHDLVQSIDAGARVVYVDKDPVAVAQSEDILAGNPTARIIAHDFTDPAAVLADEAVQELVFASGEPVAVLMSAIGHFVTDDALLEHMVAEYRAAMPPGSYLMMSVASHSVADGDMSKVTGATDRYSEKIAPMKLRSVVDLAHLMRDFDLVEPGVVHCAEWRPEPWVSAPAGPPLPIICAVGRKA
jgi:hypothetical protein